MVPLSLFNNGMQDLEGGWTENRGMNMLRKRVCVAQIHGANWVVSVDLSQLKGCQTSAV